MVCVVLLKGGCVATNSCVIIKSTSGLAKIPLSTIQTYVFCFSVAPVFTRQPIYRKARFYKKEQGAYLRIVLLCSIDS